MRSNVDVRLPAINFTMVAYVSSGCPRQFLLMDAYFLRIAAGTPLPTAILEVSDQLLLFRIDPDPRMTLRR
jgi:hypothetical protein